MWDELPGLSVHAIDAPPATAVFAACLGAFGDLPDLVASGINPGANTGHLVLHSGTVGATLTGGRARHPRARGVASTWSTDAASTTGTPRRAFAAAAVEWVAKPDGDATRPQHQRPEPARSHEVHGVREAELAPHGEVWVASADVSAGDLKIEIQGRADPAPGTDVALIHEATCRSRR